MQNDQISSLENKLENKQEMFQALQSDLEVCTYVCIYKLYTIVCGQIKGKTGGISGIYTCGQVVYYYTDLCVVTDSIQPTRQLNKQHFNRFR